jgi:hypothetical protein
VAPGKLLAEKNRQLLALELPNVMNANYDINMLTEFSPISFHTNQQAVIDLVIIIFHFILSARDVNKLPS